MAKGDIVSDIQDLAADANLDFQPAIGVEVLITEIGSETWTAVVIGGTPDVEINVIDGTLNSAHIYADPGGVAYPEAFWQKPMKILINNDRYLRIVNRGGVTSQIFYCGIQIKG